MLIDDLLSEDWYDVEKQATRYFRTRSAMQHCGGVPEHVPAG